MSTCVLEGLFCFLISLSCLATCCRVTKCCHCNGEHHFSYNSQSSFSENSYSEDNSYTPLFSGMKSSLDESENSQEETHSRGDVISKELPQIRENESSIKTPFPPVFAGKDIIKEEMECSICLEKYIFGDELRFLSCGHCFHLKCYKKWAPSDEKEGCPFCNQPIKTQSILDPKKSFYIL